MRHGDTIDSVVYLSYEVTRETAEWNRATDLEERFTAFMSYCPAPAVLRDAAGRFVWANCAYLTQHELDPENYVGHDAATLLAPTMHVDRESFQEADQRVLATGRPYATGRRDVLRDGGVIHETAYRFPVDTTSGRRLVGGIFVNAIGQGTARSQTTHWRDRDQRLFDRLSVALALTDTHTFIREANPELCGLLRTPLHALRRLTMTDLTLPGDERAQAVALGELAAGRARSTDFACGFRSSPAGSPVYATVSIALAEDGDAHLWIINAVPGSVRAKEEPIELVRRIIELRAACTSVDTIADQVGLSRRGVECHLSRLAKAWNCTTGALVARAYTLGLLDPGVWPPKCALKDLPSTRLWISTFLWDFSPMRVEFEFHTAARGGWNDLSRERRERACGGEQAARGTAGRPLLFPG
ncbi:PAS domain-containing protein [Amycolatopsis sp. NPDC004378]